MGWEIHHGLRYFYRRYQDENGRKRRKCMGRGLDADQAAADHQELRERAAADLAQVSRLRAERRELDSQTVELDQDIDRLLAAEMISAGYYQRGHKWRKKRMFKQDRKTSAAAPRTGQSTAAPGKPAETSGPSFDALTAKQKLELLATKGYDPGVAVQIRNILKENPRYWQECLNVAADIELLWIAMLQGVDPVGTQAMVLSLEAKRKEWASADPTPMEKALVARAVFAWLQVQCADSEAALGKMGEHPLPLRKFYLHEQESAERRLQAALRSLSEYQRQRGGIRIEVNHRNVPDLAAGNTSRQGAGGPNASDAGEVTAPAARLGEVLEPTGPRAPQGATR